MSRVTWMSNLSLVIGDKPLNKIIIPGTHDSHSYAIDLNNCLGDFKIRLASKLGRKLPCVRKMITDWTLTQDRSVLSQLIMGVRYFDFRVSYSERCQRYYMSHSFACVYLEDVLAQIRTFVVNNTGEIVIFTITPDWENRITMTHERNNEVINTVIDHFTSLLIRVSPQISTYNKLISEGTRVMFFYNSWDIDIFPEVWLMSCLYSPWDNTSNMEVKKEMISRDMERLSGNKINNISLVLTPQKSDIKKDIFLRIVNPFHKANSVLVMSKKINSYLDEFIDRYWDQVGQIWISFDFPAPQMIDKVIKLNFYN